MPQKLYLCNKFREEMSEMLDTYNPQGEMVIYQTEDGKASVDVMLENETVWLTQKQMALLFDKDQSVIARHIANVFEEGELDKSNMQILHNTMFKYRPTAVYNLDVIIAVGYRVRSQRGTHPTQADVVIAKNYLSELLRFSKSNRVNYKEEKIKLL